MKRIFILNLLICCGIFLNSQTNAQVFAGDDILLCNGGNVALNAEVTGVMGTTAYTVTSQTWSPDVIGGTSINLTDDAVSAVQPIGFSFCFFGNTYTNFYIGSNGWVGFTAGQSTAFSSQSLPSAAFAVPKNCIMGPWQDWHPGVGSNIGNYIKYQTLGTAPNRRLVVTWDNVPMFSCTSNLGKFQIILYETTNVIRNNIFAKPICTFSNGGNGTQGIHNLAGTVTYTIPGRNSAVWTATNETWDYLPNGLVWTQNGTPVGTTASISVSPNTTTNYVANVTLCDGTIYRDTVQVIIGSAINFENSIITATNCSNQIGSIEVIAESGSPGPFTYDWLELESDSNLLENLNDGSYNLTLTDQSNDCIYTATFEVPINSTLSLSMGEVDIDCTGANNGVANVVATSEFPGFSYQWNDPNSQTSPEITNLAPGLYAVTVTDADGCEENAFVIISEPTPLDIQFSETLISCPGGSDGTITASPNGGVGNYSLIWDGNEVGTTLSGLATGEYGVTLYDGNGCSHEETFAITDPAPISASFIVNPPSCAGILDGLVSAQGMGGNGPYSYFWPYDSSTSEILENLTSGEYTVLITDANNCLDSAVVSISPVLQLEIDPTVSSPQCFGDNDASIEVSVSGGAPNYSYLWNDFNGQSTPLATNLTAGTYSVLVEDANGCQGELTVIIDEPQPLSFTSSTTNPLCASGNDGSVIITPTGGTTGYQIDWTQNINGFTVGNLTAGTYSFTLYDANDCAVNGDVILTQPSLLQVSATEEDALCFNSATGSAVTTASGGVAPYTYTWSENSINSPSNNSLSAGAQIVTVTDQNGCQATDSFIIEQPSALTGNVTTTPASCNQNDGTATVFANGGTAPYQYTWNGAPTVQPTFNSLVSGAYTMVVSDVYGCSITLNYSVDETPVEASFIASANEGMTPFLVEFINTSSGANQYIWDFGDGSLPVATNNTEPIYHTYTSEGFFNAILYASYDGDCGQIDSLNMTAYQVSEISKIPNIFSPNGDGDNDSFRIISTNLKSFQMYIFDRWGRSVYELQNPTEEWSGNDNDAGVYFYTLEASGFDGQTFSREGTIMIVR